MTKGGAVTPNRMNRVDVFRMVKRRMRQAELGVAANCHTFRATGITAMVEQEFTATVQFKRLSGKHARTWLAQGLSNFTIS